MYKLFSAILFAVLCFSITQGNSAQRTIESFVGDELLVKVAPETTLSDSYKIHEKAGAELIQPLGDLGWQLVKIKAGLSSVGVENNYRRMPSVIAVQPNYYYQLLSIPNDPLFPSPSMYGLTNIAAPQAWNLTTGSPSIVVANIDTGMRLTHEDLAENIWTNPEEIPGNGIDDDGNGFIDDVHGWDFRFSVSDPSDQHGHGTHVGGTIGAVGNNGVGVVGVNWNVKIMVIKIFSQAANDTTSAMLINAYNYVRMMKERGVNIRVTNNSYGGCNEACGYDQATKDAIDSLGDASVLNVFAAGNSGVNTDYTPFYPGSYASPSILNVASSTSADIRSGFSNYGFNTVDIAAPGSGILSTRFLSDSSYGNSSGTSMAAPHVSGAAALLLSYRPELDVASLKATLMNSSDQLKAFDGLVRSGGRLNVFNSLTTPTVCWISLPKDPINVPTKGGVFSIPINTQPNCGFNVRSDVSWIHILDGRVIDGPTDLQVRITVNPTISRTGTISIGDMRIKISQDRVRQ